jgi:hypothetical protein
MHSIETRGILAICVSGLLLFGAAGCGDDTDPLSSAEDMLGSHDGPNTTLTKQNAGEVIGDIMDEVIGEIFDEVEWMAMEEMYQTGKQAQPPTGTLVVELDGRELAGYYSGKAVLKKAKVTFDFGDEGERSLTNTVKVELHDFSTDGELFVGGTYDASMTMTGSMYEEEMESLTAWLKAYLAVAGTYSGTISLDIEIAGDFGEDDESITVTGTGTVNGEAINAPDYISFD